jgi:flagellar export protein FliJ
MATASRLTRMLRLRTQLRTLRQHEVDTLAATAAALAVRRRALDDERERRAAEEARAAAGGLLAPETFHLGRRYDAALAAEERRCGAEATEVGEALAAKRAELQEERREERKFERLAETQRRRAAEAESRATEVLLDELAIVGHGRVRPRSDT